MQNLISISKQVEKTCENLEKFYNSEIHYNHILSEDLQKMNQSMQKIASDLKQINDFFFGL